MLDAVRLSWCFLSFSSISQRTFVIVGMKESDQRSTGLYRIVRRCIGFIVASSAYANGTILHGLIVRGHLLTRN